MEPMLLRLLSYDFAVGKRKRNVSVDRFSRFSMPISLQLLCFYCAWFIVQKYRSNAFLRTLCKHFRNKGIPFHDYFLT